MSGFYSSSSATPGGNARVLHQTSSNNNNNSNNIGQHSYVITGATGGRTNNNNNAYDESPSSTANYSNYNNENYGRDWSKIGSTKPPQSETSSSRQQQPSSSSLAGFQYPMVPNNTTAPNKLSTSAPTTNSSSYKPNTNNNQDRYIDTSLSQNNNQNTNNFRGLDLHSSMSEFQKAIHPSASSHYQHHSNNETIAEHLSHDRNHAIAPRDGQEMHNHEVRGENGVILPPASAFRGGAPPVVFGGRQVTSHHPSTTASNNNNQQQQQQTPAPSPAVNPSNIAQYSSATNASTNNNNNNSARGTHNNNNNIKIPVLGDARLLMLGLSPDESLIHVFTYLKNAFAAESGEENFDIWTLSAPDASGLAQRIESELLRILESGRPKSVAPEYRYGTTYTQTSVIQQALKEKNIHAQKLVEAESAIPSNKMDPRAFNASRGESVDDNNNDQQHHQQQQQQQNDNTAAADELQQQQQHTSSRLPPPPPPHMVKKQLSEQRNGRGGGVSSNNNDDDEQQQQQQHQSLPPPPKNRPSSMPPTGPPRSSSHQNKSAAPSPAAQQRAVDRSSLNNTLNNSNQQPQQKESGGPIPLSSTRSQRSQSATGTAAPSPQNRSQSRGRNHPTGATGGPDAAVPGPLFPDRPLKETMSALRHGAVLTKYALHNDGKPQLRFFRLENLPTVIAQGAQPVPVPHLCWSADAKAKPNTYMCLMNLQEVVLGANAKGIRGVFKRNDKRQVIGARGEPLAEQMCVTYVFPDREVNICPASERDFDVWYYGMVQVLERNRQGNYTKAGKVQQPKAERQFSNVPPTD